MWQPTNTMYLYELAALCGTTTKAIKATIEELKNERLFSDDWHTDRTTNWRGAQKILEHYKVDTSNADQVITILSIARDKNDKRKFYYRKKQNFKK